MNIKFVGKLVLLLISIIPIGAGSFGTFIGHSLVHSYNDAINHEAARFPVDLSEPGDYRSPFVQKYVATYGKQFRFEIEPPFVSEEEMRTALKDFKAHILITKQDREIVFNEYLTLQNFLEDDSPGCRWYAPMQDFTPYVFFDAFDAISENSQLQLTVSSPAPVLKGKTQQMVVKNVFCLCESTNICTGWVLIVIGLIAALAGLFIIYRLIRSSLKNKKDLSTSSTSC
jgi:hypothetical protein